MCNSSGVMRTIGPTHGECNAVINQYLAIQSQGFNGRDTAPTIFLVLLLNPKNKMSLLIDVEVEFVPPADGGILWTGEAGQRVVEEAVKCE